MGMRRILSIDGGGIRGTFPAALLAELESDLPVPIGSYFDLIAGTSTGGIIAIGLGLDIPASEILDLYECHGPEIFDQESTGIRGWLQRRTSQAKWVWGPKYSSESLRNHLQSAFGEKRLGDSRARLLIPAWHPKTGHVYIFKTSHHERLTTDYKELAVDAALATASAPTYFAQHTTISGTSLVDGGVWANNPCGLAVVEAIGVLGWSAKDLRVLSIGCLDEVSEPRGAYGAARIAKRLSNLFMAGQSHGSLGTAKILTGDPHSGQRIYRVSQPVAEGFYTLDNTRRIKDLKDRALAEAREQCPILKPIFFSQPAQEFQPLVARGAYQ